MRSFKKKTGDRISIDGRTTIVVVEIDKDTVRLRVEEMTSTGAADECTRDPSSATGRLLTLAQAAEQMRVSNETLRKMVTHKQITYIRIGIRRGTIRFDANDIDDWIKHARRP